MADLDKLARLTRQFEWAISGEKITKYKPYQWQKDFHAAGKSNPERMLMAANRVGKTMSAAAEVSYHLTGRYPEWWEGKTFDKPVLVWTGSPTNETSRDIIQTELLGGLGEKLGTGSVPRRYIRGQPQTRQAGVKNVIDTFAVEHKSGGLSLANLKTYEQGWQKWQGTAPHVVWLDEEPEDENIFFEAQTRVLTSSGILLVTFTPLRGHTKIVDHFSEGKKGTYLKTATWDDAPHLDPVAKQELIERYPAYQRDARTKGIPMLGSGAVFPIPDSSIGIDIIKIPDHFARIKGIDFGLDHPAAGVEIAYDRDQDVIYVIDAYKKANETIPYHAAWLNKSNKDVPVSWPHDGMNRERQGGKTLAQQYREAGVNMLSKSARYPKTPGQEETGGSQPVEPIVVEVFDRMLTNRFKVFNHLREWFEEKNSYHRDKDGKIVPKRDDVLKATFYAVMMKRYAASLNELRHPRVSSAPTAPIATTRI